MLVERGDIVLLAFPFSSEAGAEQRPAFVLLGASSQTCGRRKTVGAPQARSNVGFGLVNGETAISKMLR